MSPFDGFSEGLASDLDMGNVMDSLLTVGLTVSAIGMLMDVLSDDEKAEARSAGSYLMSMGVTMAAAAGLSEMLGELVPSSTPDLSQSQETGVSL